MIAFLSSVARTPPRSPVMGIMMRFQCLPLSVVRSKVPAAPAIQQIFALGAEAASSLAYTPNGCEVQSLPAVFESKIWPASPNFHTHLFSPTRPVLNQAHITCKPPPCPPL